MLGQVEQYTINELFDRYKALKLPQLRRGKDYEAAIVNFIKGWEDCYLRDLPHAELINRLDYLALNRPALANRTLSYMKAFFSWSFSRGLIDRNPLMGVAKPAREMPRNRWLNISELRLLWDALDEFGYPFGVATQLLILTAGRNSEVSNLEHKEIQFSDDGDPESWELPPARSKTGASFRVPFVSQAQTLLKPYLSYSQQATSPFLFTTTGQSPISGWSRFKRNLDQALKKMSAGKPNVFNEPWRIHDIRRSFATIAIDELNIDFVVADRCLNHCASGSMSVVARVYAKAEMYQLRKQALQKWADYVCG